MHYYIINRIENENGVLKYTPIGYSLDYEFVKSINTTYDYSLGAWIELNVAFLESGVKTMSDYFVGGVVKAHIARTISNNDAGLAEITEVS